MIDTRSRSALLRLKLPVPRFLLERFEMAGMLVEILVVGLRTLARAKRSQQLRGFSARVVYNGRAGLQKKRLKETVKALRNPVLRRCIQAMP